MDNLRLSHNRIYERHLQGGSPILIRYKVESHDQDLPHHDVHTCIFSSSILRLKASRQRRAHLVKYIYNLSAFASSFTSTFLMPLFRDHPVRSTVAGAVVVGFAHFMTKLLSSTHAFHLTQTSVAILAILSMMAFVTMHHRREGQLMTQTQEEMVLICAFGLFWVAMLIAWRAFSHRTGNLGPGDIDLPMASAGGPESWFTGGIRPYPCASDDIYCVVEDYTFF